MNRTPLTDEDIVTIQATHAECTYMDGEWVCVVNAKGSPRLDEGEKQAEQLKKQILDDYEYYEKHDNTNSVLLTINEVKELKEKADELDDLKSRFIVIGNMIEAMETIQRNNTKLEQENKQLKEKLKDWMMFNRGLYTFDWKKFEEIIGDKK